MSEPEGGELVSEAAEEPAEAESVCEPEGGELVSEATEETPPSTSA